MNLVSFFIEAVETVFQQMLKTTASVSAAAAAAAAAANSSARGPLPICYIFTP